MDKITQPIIVKTAEIIDEGLNYKTFVFNYSITAFPGQYLMLWLPGEDLKPFAVAWQNPKSFALSVLKRGNFTTKLFELKIGDQLGFTGPYGTYYNLTSRKKILLIGGGSGVSSVTFLAQEAIKQNLTVDFVLAAASKEGIIFEPWLTNQGVNVYHRFQDNLSRTILPQEKLVRGKYEHAWDLIVDLINKNDYDGLYACGPELLLKKIVDLSLTQNIFCQVSLERYIKCGIGVCGKCCVDNSGLCLCQAGPVVNNHLASQIAEFGKYHRDSSGQKIYFKN